MVVAAWEVLDDAVRKRLREPASGSEREVEGVATILLRFAMGACDGVLLRAGVNETASEASGGDEIPERSDLGVAVATTWWCGATRSGVSRGGVPMGYIPVTDGDDVRAAGHTRGPGPDLGGEVREEEGKHFH
jgi:hypothetical protein